MGSSDMKRYITITIILSIALFFLLQALLVPKYMSSLHEGAMTAEYYRETRSMISSL
jgi:hypothetical protein